MNLSLVGMAINLFCLVVALVEPHVPWVMGDASAYPPQQLRLPANIADTVRTREDYGKYLAEITYMDNQVGELLAALKRLGREDDTVVIFSSEQGAQFSRLQMDQLGYRLAHRTGRSLAGEDCRWRAYGRPSAICRCSTNVGELGRWRT